MSHLTTPQRHLFEPISPPITFYTQPTQRHIAPLQAQASRQQNYIWPQFNNPLTFNTPFNSFEPEAEFVPLEAQQQQNQRSGQQSRNNEEKPFGEYWKINLQERKKN